MINFIVLDLPGDLRGAAAVVPEEYHQKLVILFVFIYCISFSHPAAVLQ